VVFQQTIASNDVVANKKLLASLRRRSPPSTRPRPITNRFESAGHTGEEFESHDGVECVRAIFDSTLDIYVDALLDLEDDLATTLNGTYPSKVHTSAIATLDQLLAALHAADTQCQFPPRGEVSFTSVKTYGKAQKAVDKATQAAAPPASVTATVSGSSSFAYKSIIGAAVSFSGGNATINSGQAILKAPYGQRGVVISLSGVNPGANTLAIGAHASGLTELLVYQQLGLPMLATPAAPGL